MSNAKKNERSVAEVIAKFGPVFNPEVMAGTRALYTDLIALPPQGMSIASDIPYGVDPRQTIDVHGISDAPKNPVLLFVPGGGFVAGDKRIDSIFYRNVGDWFLGRHFVVVAMNYRLAPSHPWPAGAEDVRSVLEWIRANISQYGGDPANVFVFGHSAGATHVGTVMFDPRFRLEEAEPAGVFLLSGVYRLAEHGLTPNLAAYFGTDPSQYPSRSVLTYAAEVKAPPILLGVAEFDPPALSSPTYLLADAITRCNGRPVEVAWFSQHNHISTVFSFGSGDDAVGEAVVKFAQRVSPGAGGGVPV